MDGELYCWMDRKLELKLEKLEELEELDGSRYKSYICYTQSLSDRWMLTC
jgi:hypothetical protein